jgi:putative oxidoreductase
MSYVILLAVIALKLYLGWTFGKAAYSKLSGDPQMVGAFDFIGYGQGFRYFTGAVEALAVVLILLPFATTVALGATLLIATMFGAIYTHLKVFKDEGGWRKPALLLLLSIILVILGT